MMANTNKLFLDRPEKVNLTVGSPHFSTPAAATIAAHEAIDLGKTRYTPTAGIPELREAIVRKFRDDGVDYSVDQTMVGVGAKLLLLALFLGDGLKGQEVIIPAPYYASYPSLVKLTGGTPIIVHTHSADQFKLTPEALRKSLSDKVRWLVLNSPSNPTGAVYSPEELLALGEVLKAFPNVLVLSDEIYQSFVYEGVATNFASLSEDLFRRTVTLNGVSKTYGMTGWRIGYAAGPLPVIERAISVQSDIVNCPSSISQEAALAALIMDQDEVRTRNASLVEHRDLGARILSASDHLQIPLPTGAFYLFPAYVKWPHLMEEQGGFEKFEKRLINYLADEAGVLVTPGSRFGQIGNFRINFTVAREELELGCNRLVAGINKFYELEGPNA